MSQFYFSKFKNQPLSFRKNSQKSKARGSRPPPVISLNDDTACASALVQKLPSKIRLRSNSMKANKFHGHDQYRLPEVDLEEAATKATHSAGLG